MRKKVISSMVAIVTMFNLGIGINVYATPETEEKVQEIKYNQDEYEEIKNTIAKLEDEIDSLTGQIESIFFKIEEGNVEIKKFEEKIKNEEENIFNIGVSVNEQQQILGERLRATYKGSFYNNYLSILLSSENFSNLLENINVVSKVFSLDKEIIDNLNKEKQDLENSMQMLAQEQEELKKINEENTKRLEELNEKKNKQQVVIDELNEKKNSIVGYMEILENQLLEPFIGNITSEKTVEELNDLITSLEGLKKQIQTDSIIKNIDSNIIKAQSIILNKQGNITGEKSNNYGEVSSSVEPNNKNAASIISYAYQFIGSAYVYGATGPGSFDCSGFTQYVFNKFGYSLTRTTYTQVKQGIYVSRENLRPGDLVFTRGTAEVPEHVGIYVGNGKMIHASRPGVGVIVGDIYNYVTARRIVN